MSSTSKTASTACPCGSGASYTNCCQRYHAGTPAPDAEALMRSRYTAFVLRLEDYLRQSWHPDTCPAELHLDEEPAPQWLGLEVKKHQTQDADHATVEFVARFRIQGRGQRLHEISRFVRQDGHWRYLDGDFPEKSKKQ